MSARLLNTPQILAGLNGSPQYRGTIATAGATAVNNSTTAAPFTLISGRIYLIQMSGGAGYFNSYVLAASATTTANGVKLLTDERVTFTSTPDETFISVIRDTTDVTLKVWELV